MMAIWAAFAAGFVAILATISVERMGGLWGGVLASIPTTIVPAAVGFYYAKDGFVAPLLAVPFGMLVNAFFLYSWRILPSRISVDSFWIRLMSMVILSLSIWMICALASVWLQNYYSSLLLSILMTVFQLLLGIWACAHNPPAPKGSKKVGLGALLIRGVLAGTAIGVAITLSHLGALAGIASVFPAIFLTTMVSVWISQGEAVQGGSVGPMMLGSTSVSVFAMLAIVLFPIVNPLWGAIICWFLSVLLISLPTALWLKRITTFQD
jgi:hypothetical protein